MRNENKTNKEQKNMKNLQAKSVVNELTAFFQKIEDKFNAPIGKPGDEDYELLNDPKDWIKLMYSFTTEDSGSIMLGTDGMLLDIVVNGMVDEFDYSELYDEFHSLLDDTTWDIEPVNYGLFHLYKEVI